MNFLAVKTGSGSFFDLRLPRGEAGKKLIFILQELFRKNDETFRCKVIESTRVLFPENWRRPLDYISEADARKLGKALLIALREELPRHTFREEECSCRREEEKCFDTFKREVPRHTSREEECSCRREEEKCFDTFKREVPLNTVREDKPLNAEKQEACLNFSTEVIQAAYCYKWTLEYACALPRELLQRCLEVAAGKGRFAPSAPAAALHLSPGEIKKAAARGAAAIRKYQEQK